MTCENLFVNNSYHMLMFENKDYAWKMALDNSFILLSATIRTDVSEDEILIRMKKRAEIISDSKNSVWVCEIGQPIFFLEKYVLYYSLELWKVIVGDRVGWLAVHQALDKVEPLSKK